MTRLRRSIFLTLQSLAGLLGAAMIALGAWLVVLGGSAYYLSAGALLLFGAVTAWRGRATLAVGAGVAALGLTLIWSLIEIAGKGWIVMGVRSRGPRGAARRTGGGSGDCRRCAAWSAPGTPLYAG